jgi:hypothetical protein
MLVIRLQEAILPVGLRPAACWCVEAGEQHWTAVSLLRPRTRLPSPLLLLGQLAEVGHGNSQKLM